MNYLIGIAVVGFLLISRLIIRKALDLSVDGEDIIIMIFCSLFWPGVVGVIVITMPFILLYRWTEKHKDDILSKYNEFMNKWWI